MGDGQTVILQPGQTIRPQVDKKTATDLVHRLYGLKVRQIFELNAYDDKNFHVICDGVSGNPWITEVLGDGYVLKIMNSLDSKKTSFVEGQTDLLIFLNENQINSPLPVKNLNNRYFSEETIGGGLEKHVVRLLAYRSGNLLLDVEISDDFLTDVGQFAATIDQTLKKFHHPAYDEYRSLWMLSSVPSLRDFVYAVDSAEKRLIVNEVIAKFEDEVMRKKDELETGIIHGDLNEQNILVDDGGNRILAVLDLGDSQKSCLIFELAIVMCYMLLKVRDMRRLRYVLEGYRRVRKPTVFEMKILKICVCARLCQSLVLGAYSHINDPQNEYVLGTQKTGWAILEELWPLGEKELSQIWD